MIVASCRLALSVVLVQHHLEPTFASTGMLAGGLLITEENTDISLLTSSWGCVFFLCCAFVASASSTLEDSSPSIPCHLEHSHLPYRMGIISGQSRGTLLAHKRTCPTAREMSL